MPYILVKSLPIARSFDVSTAIAGLTDDFARETGILLEHISAIWEFVPAGQYGVGGRTAQVQPPDSHPVMVELLAPDFHSSDKIESMFRALAASIAKRAGVNIENVFIQLNRAHAGMVFDGGKVVRW